MRLWRFWIHTIVWSSQHNPLRFVELLMLVLAMALLATWQILPKLPYPGWPYLVLGLSFMVGAATTMLVREAIAPSSQPEVTQIAAVILLLISGIYGFLELSPYI